MARTLIVYYSLTGTARRVAELLRQMTQWQMLEVFDAQAPSGLHGDKPMPGYACCGPDASQFDCLVVVAPVWLGELAAPLRGLLRDVFKASQAQRVKQVSLICVVGLDGVANAAAEAARLVGRPLLPLLVLSHDDVADASCVNALQAFADTLSALDKACRPCAPQA